MVVKACGRGTGREMLLVCFAFKAGLIGERKGFWMRYKGRSEICKRQKEAWDTIEFKPLGNPRRNYKQE